MTAARAMLVAHLGLAWTSPAAAQAVVAPDVSVSTVGLQTWSESSIRDVQPSPTDMDLLLSERLRWTLVGDRSTPGTDVVAVIDGRFIVDPGPEGRPIEWGYVRTLGAQVATERWLVDVGRSQVYRGGPRLVDGVQAVFLPSDTVRVGVWAGLAPNLFTTVPMVRPGGGPILSYATSKVQLSLVGEAVTYEGAIDRAGMLGMARVSVERTFDVSGRLDVELLGPLDAPRLVDGMIAIVGNPSPSLRIDALYDAFSSYRYLGSEALDPSLDRFSQRLLTQVSVTGLVQDVRDPTLNHLVGGGVRLQPDTGGAAPRLGLVARYRYHPDEDNRYLRINPQAGIVRLGGVLDVLADANYIQLGADADLLRPGGEERTGEQIDGGLMVYFEPDDSAVALDGSVRAVSYADELPGIGFYGDLFVNVVSPGLDVVFVAGGAAMTEADLIDGQQSLGLQAFVSMSKYLRPPRR